MRGRCLNFPGGILTCLLFILCFIPSAAPSAIASGAGAVRILATGGEVQVSEDGTAWHTPTSGETLSEGATIRTGPDGFVDFLIEQSGASLRLPSDSELHFDQLSGVSVGETVVSNTRLELLNGSVIGSQSKLHNPSTFEIATAAGAAQLNATEYVVRADGAVSVFAGSVTVRYNEPGAGGSIRVRVNPGQSFDPETGEVVETSPEFLEDLIAEVETTRRNAEVYKVSKATVIVKPEEFVSPTKGLQP